MACSYLFDWTELDIGTQCVPDRSTYQASCDAIRSGQPSHCAQLNDVRNRTNWSARSRSVSANVYGRSIPSGAAGLIGRSFQATNLAIAQLEVPGNLKQVNVVRRNRASQVPELIGGSPSLNAGLRVRA